MYADWIIVAPLIEDLEDEQGSFEPSHCRGSGRPVSGELTTPYGRQDAAQ